LAGCGNNFFPAVERCGPAPTETLTRPHERDGSGSLAGLFGVHGFIDGVPVVPEPATLGVLALGGLVALRRRR
jgi:hypothetical protein